MNDPLNFLISVVAVTFLLVLFGEVAPKVYANQNSMKIACFMSGPLTVMNRLFKYISWILVNSTQFVEQRLRDNMNQKAVTQEDIASAIELTVKDNKYAKQDVDILKGIIRFGNTAAAEIITFITGDPFFPGGMKEITFKKGSFLCCAYISILFA